MKNEITSDIQKLLGLTVLKVFVGLRYILVQVEEEYIDRDCRFNLSFVFVYWNTKQKERNGNKNVLKKWTFISKDKKWDF